MKGKITITGEGVLQRDSNDLVKTPKARRQITALKDIPVQSGPVVPSPWSAGKEKELDRAIDVLRSHESSLSGEYHEDCNKLMLENTELKAQVERLREFVLEVRDEFPCDYDTVNELLKETSAQSLLLHNAEVLECMANSVDKFDGADGFVCIVDRFPRDCKVTLLNEANALRKRAKEAEDGS